MKIKECTYYGAKYDFKAIFKCPHCGAEYEAWGYNDGNFHFNVMPNAICRKCGKSESGESEAEQKERLGYTYHI